MSDLLDLAERCEQAAGPDIGLDVEIAQLVNDMLPEGTKRWTWKADHISLPRYTSSLDAVIRLVPEGCDWLRWGPGSMVVSLPRQPGDAEKSWARTIEAKGATPALALAAAALRASFAMKLAA